MTATAPADADAAAGRRRYLRAARAGAGVALVLFTLVLTFGRLDVAPNELLGNFYDAQADAMLDGHLAVDPDEVSFEGFRMESGTYIYFGPVPALMRLPVVALTDRFHGRLTRLSMLAAYATALWFVTRLHWRLRGPVRGIGGGSVGRRELWWVAVSTFGIGASSGLYLASRAWVYHEALLWGSAFSLASFDHLVRWLTAGDSRDSGSSMVRPESRERGGSLGPAVWAGVFAGLALLTRASVGAGPVAALGLVALAAMVVRARPGGVVERVTGVRRVSTAALVVLAAGVLVPVGAYSAVNHAKFGSWFGLPLDKQVLVAFDADRRESLAANGNSLFGLRYAPSVAAQVLRPDALGGRAVFPFVGFPHARPAVLGDVRFAELDWASSLPSSEPLLFLGALMGLAALVAPRRLAPAGHLDAVRLPVLGALVGGAAFCILGYIANRYLTDLLPLLVLTGLVGFHVVVGRVTRTADGRSGRVLGIVLVALALWGAYANTALALQYQREIAPGVDPRQRALWLRLQERLGPDPPYRRIGANDPLPTRAPLGAIVVVGDCAGLYRGDGDVWQPVEGGEGIGRFDLDLRLTSTLRRSAVVVSGAGNELQLAPAGGGRVRFSAAVRAGGTRTETLPGQPIRLVLGRTYRLDVTLDWRSGYAEVRLADRTLFAATAAFRPGRVQVNGAFPGRISSGGRRPAACRALVGS